MAEALPGDRRPIAVRSTRWAQWLTARLIARQVSADAISIAGMGLGCAAGLGFAATAWWSGTAGLCWLGGAVLVQLRLLCNLLDGMVAVGSGKASRLGELFNEIPDRVSDSAILIGFGCAAGGAPWLGLLAALLAMATAYVRAVGKGVGAGSDFRGPMAKQQRMFAVTIAALGLAFAPADWSWRWGPAGQWGLPAGVLLLIAAGCLWTCARRLQGIVARLREVGP